MRKEGIKLAIAEVKKTICGMCSKSCGIDVYLKEGKIIDVRGMKEHPMSKGVICEKAKFAPELQYSNDRLVTPLLKRGDVWERVSWDRALEHIAQKLTEIKSQYGPEALAVYLGNSVGLRDAKRYAVRFCDTYGTPNYSSVDMLCHWSRTMATDMTVGGYPVPDEMNAKCIIVWGTNPEESNITEYHDILTAKKRGAKLIVIDPRETRLARKADIYIQIRPQTDCALALGMINVIIVEGLYDKQFVDTWTIGFEQLKDHVKEYSPETVSAITGVPADMIYRAARTYAFNKPACLSQHIAIDHGINGFQAIRAMTILESIMGNIDVTGGGKLVPGAKTQSTRVTTQIHPKTTGLEGYPLFINYMNQAHGMNFAETILNGSPYPIKGMIFQGSNPLLTWPDTDTTERALRKLDFLVVMDLFMTKTASIADLVLPACTFLERTELCDYGYFQGVPILALRSKICDPPGDNYPDWKFWSELAKKLGYEEYFPWENNEDMLDYVLKPSGITATQLKVNPAGVPYTQDKRQQYLAHGFNTPSGKIELYSERLEGYGYDPLPKHIEPLESPIRDRDLSRNYPLCLITGARVIQYWQSSFRTLQGPAKRYPEPLAEINNGLAKQLGIKNGDRVIVETLRGSITIKAKVTKSIHPCVVSIPLGWENSNVNVLTSYDGRDSITGYPAFKSILCKVNKA